MSRPRPRRRNFILAQAIEPLERRLLLAVSFEYATTPAHLAPGVGGALYYTNDDGIHGDEVWRTDGTPAGTVMLKDINPGKVGSKPVDDSRFREEGRRPIFTWNNATYFSADDGVHGAELWKTNGTAAGTVLLRDLNPGEYDTTPDEFVSFKGALYFNGIFDDGDALWMSDGTTKGTIRVSNALGDHVHGFTVVGNVLYFLTTNRSFGAGINQLWKSDGTTKGTVPVGVSLPNADERNGISLHNLAGQLLIVAPETSDDREFPDGTVWKLNTATSTLVTLLTNYELHPVASLNGKLLLAEAQTPEDYNGYYQPSPLVLWETDGSVAGTKVLWEGVYKKVDENDPSLTSFHQAGNALYFEQKVDDGFDRVSELWRTDGTAAGTKLVKHGGFELQSYEHLSQFTFLDGVTYFADGDKLWKTDGSAGGTVAIADWPEFGEYASDPPVREVTAMAGRLYFAGTDDFRGAELWSYRPASNQMLLLRSVQPEILLRRGRLGIDGSDFDDSITINVSAGAGTFTIYWDSAPSSTYKLADVTGISIRGQGGNDRITINGVLPAVTLAGGDGNDTITGGGSGELIVGGFGDDSLEGGGGNDTIKGDDDDSEETGGGGRDFLNGGDGNDQLFGGSESDSLYGGAGDDQLHGGSADDSLWGEAGNDGVYGEADQDHLSGGLGGDLISGGDGADYVDYTDRVNPLIISLDSRARDGEAGERDYIVPDVETVAGGSGNDLISGTAGKDALYGGGGDDTLQGWGGNDTLYGEDGNDSLLAGDGNDQINGGMGRDYLEGGKGNDTFYSGNDDSARDYLYGGRGHDAALTDLKDVRSTIEELLY